ncbi:MAG: hypothetical protein WA160_13870 [Pseudobdellovibrio sp.]
MKYFQVITSVGFMLCAATTFAVSSARISAGEYSSPKSAYLNQSVVPKYENGDLKSIFQSIKFNGLFTYVTGPASGSIQCRGDICGNVKIISATSYSYKGSVFNKISDTLCYCDGGNQTCYSDSSKNQRFCCKYNDDGDISEECKTRR